MEETLNYIDRYFQGQLQEAEKVAFEQRCETDSGFAEAVSFYLTARQTVKKELHEQKKAEFQQLYQELSKHPVQRPGTVRRMMPYLSAAAASVLIFLGWYFFFNNPSPQQLAEQYIHDNLNTLSVTMGNNQDSLQLGLAAFNRRDFHTAEKLFLGLAQRNDPEGIRYLGILYLVNNQYDKALAQFNELANNPNLYANHGLFYKAITLMKRSVGKDSLQAKQLLQEVVDKGLPGSREAASWLPNF